MTLCPKALLSVVSFFFTIFISLVFYTTQPKKMTTPDKSSQAVKKSAEKATSAMKNQSKNKLDSHEAPKALKNIITWFEIPATDFKRAVAFYNHLFGINMQTNKVNDYEMAVFPNKKGVGGAIICGEGCVPTDKGSLLYLNAERGLDNMLIRIEEAGGRVLLGKTLINDSAGHFALFMDTEGNKLALHEN